MRARRTPLLTSRLTALVALAGAVLLALLVGIAWRATSAVWFLIFPLLVPAVLAAVAVLVLWILRHF